MRVENSREEGERKSQGFIRRRTSREICLYAFIRVIQSKVRDDPRTFEEGWVAVGPLTVNAVVGLGNKVLAPTAALR